MIFKKFPLFLVIFAVMISTVTFQTYKYFQIAFTIIPFIFYLKLHNKIDKLFIRVLILVLFVTIGQYVVYDTFSFYNFIGPFLIFLTPFFILKLTGFSFFKLYVRVVYVLAIISLVFWFFQNLSESFTYGLEWISSTLKLDPGSNESIVIYNLEYGRSALGFIKNSGFTAEGGLYCTFLIPALFLNNISEFKFLGKKNLVFIISIITTSSTAGYAALALFFLYAAIQVKNKIFITFTFPIVIYSILVLVNQLPFMYDKVYTSYNKEMGVYNSANNPARRGRFLSARVDLDIIAEHPLVGKGIYEASRYLNEEEKEIGYSNSYLGIVGLASRYGLIIWFFYLFYLNRFVFLYYKMNCPASNKNKLYPYFFIFAILSTAMGQNPFYASFYVIAVYAGYYLSKMQPNIKNRAKINNALK